MSPSQSPNVLAKVLPWLVGLVLVAWALITTLYLPHLGHLTNPLYLLLPAGLASSAVGLWVGARQTGPAVNPRHGGRPPLRGKHLR